MGKLPDYMLPAAWVVVDALPLTATGKVDRRALPPPDHGRPTLEQGFVAPRDAVEEVLTGIFAQVLGLNRVGIYDGFFDLGGHSLQATQIMARLLHTLGVALPLRTLFETPTVAGLAQATRSMRSASATSQAPAITPLPRQMDGETTPRETTGETAPREADAPPHPSCAALQRKEVGAGHETDASRRRATAEGQVRAP
jgi:acyl carrier protein